MVTVQGQGHGHSQVKVKLKFKTMIQDQVLPGGRPTGFNSDILPAIRLPGYLT